MQHSVHQKKMAPTKQKQVCPVYALLLDQTTPPQRLSSSRLRENKGPSQKSIVTRVAAKYKTKVGDRSFYLLLCPNFCNY